MCSILDTLIRGPHRYGFDEFDPTHHFFMKITGNSHFKTNDVELLRYLTFQNILNPSVQIPDIAPAFIAYVWVTYSRFYMFGHYNLTQYAQLGISPQNLYHFLNPSRNLDIVEMLKSDISIKIKFLMAFWGKISHNMWSINKTAMVTAVWFQLFIFTKWRDWSI